MYVYYLLPIRIVLRRRRRRRPGFNKIPNSTVPIRILLLGKTYNIAIIITRTKCVFYSAAVLLRYVRARYRFLNKSTVVSWVAQKYLTGTCTYEHGVGHALYCET